MPLPATPDPNVEPPLHEQADSRTEGTPEIVQARHDSAVERLTAKQWPSRYGAREGSNTRSCASGPMVTSSRLARGGLIAALAFLCVTAVGGGLSLIAGLFAPPVEMLAGSVFQSFLLPGLAMLLLVGGSAAFALLLVLRNHRLASYAAIAASAAIIVFEVVEIAVIGSPPGPSRAMQVFYLGLGVVIAALAVLPGTANKRASRPSVGSELTRE